MIKTSSHKQLLKRPSCQLETFISNSNMDDGSIFKIGYNIEVGTAVKDLLKIVSDLQVLTFRKSFGVFICALGKKLFDQSSIKQKIVRNRIFLDLTIMIKE
ncbi:hypothetical protein PoB_002333700 [Plakobranchus ocellatus]|uniref:Costars domain-containing protein n=1 Tax=Plakobranchus ocellatus TaxID=259542 RepID=A0AAV3ZQR1_9GAST|nr:hypothetical protein PoB_002333700 [Plakobranchus ocellatus]